jgi:hypothetical protein
LGAITKQGNRMMRMLLVEAAQAAVSYDPEFRKEYRHRRHQTSRGQNGSGTQVGHTTVLDAAYAQAVSGGRSHRE